MTITERPTGSWRLGFETLDAEVVDDVDLAVDGTIPAALDGVAWFVGPARHDVYGDRNADWNDGDGMVHRVAIRRGAATYRSRYVDTRKKRDEDRLGRRRYATFGCRPPGSFASRVRRPLPMNTASRNVVMQAGNLLALWDAGRPHRLDAHTLLTVGEDDLGGVLAPRMPFGIHPKLDARTGQLWNIGVRYGARPTLIVYRWPTDRPAEIATSVPLPWAAMVQDFALTERFVVVPVPPLLLPRVPVALLTGSRSYRDSLRWRPALGTAVAIIDRRSGDVRWHHTDASVVMNVAQAFDADEGDDVVIDCCVYPDAGWLQTTAEVMTGDLRTQAYSVLERWTLTASAAVNRRAFLPIDHAQLAIGGTPGPAATLHGLALNPLGGFPGLPAVVDTGTGRVEWASLTDSQFSSPPVAVAMADDKRAAWWLTIVLDADSRQSALWVLDSRALTVPVATAPLPHVVPLGLRGTWTSATNSDRRRPGEVT